MAQQTHTPRRKSRYYVQGYVVALALAVLTAIEYIVAVTFNSAILLIILAIFKAALVINYFMHISSLWSAGEEH